MSKLQAMSINGPGGMANNNIAVSAQDAYVAFDEQPFSVDAKGYGNDGDAKAATMGSSVFNLSNTILGERAAV